MTAARSETVLAHVKTRDGDIVAFDKTRITKAISKAYEACQVSDSTAEIEKIYTAIHEDLLDAQTKLSNAPCLDVEKIQDIVEENLIKFQKSDVAKAYILYRARQAQTREVEKTASVDKFLHNDLDVTKSDGSRQKFDIAKIETIFRKVCVGLEDACPFDELREQMKKYVIDGIKTSEIMSLLIKASIDLISVEKTQRQFIAGRLAVSDLYKKASKNRDISPDAPYSGANFADLMQTYLQKGLYFKKFLDHYSLDQIREAGDHIDTTRDFDYNYTTILMFKKRYLLNPNGETFELPQEMYMAVALFLAIPEPAETRLETAKKIYDTCSRQEISLPTPTLLNARTNFHQLSSCFKMNIGDDLRAIYHSVENMAQISKFGGGIGVYMGHLRSRGGSIRGVKGASAGVLPRAKVVNDTAIAVNQLGSRKGAISTTLDVWHRDIRDFLDMQTEVGDFRQKCFDLFPAVSFPDIFFRRLEAEGQRTLFDPDEVQRIHGKRLENHRGAEFEKFYETLENDDRIELKQVYPAKDLFKKFLKTCVETGMPYAFFRDTANKFNPNKHSGQVYSTQLCTEIIQNVEAPEFISEDDEGDAISVKYTPGQMVVCNLASINVAKVHSQEKIDEVIPVAMRILDNVISLNFFPVKESEKSCQQYRPVGLGFLGLAEHLATSKIAYDTEEARTHTSKLFERYSFATLKSSNQLAQERGHYPLFPGSDRSKGILMGKDKTRFSQNSEMADQRHELIDDIQQHGTRFGYHMAPAPNTSTSLVVGTTAGLLPIYKKYFVESNSIAPSVNIAPNITQENFRYYKEYVTLNMNDVIDLIATVQPRIDQAISFERMVNPMEVTPRELYDYYLRARKSGLKTVYYVRSLSMEIKEDCASCSG